MVGGRKEEDLYGPGSTRWMLSALEGSSLRPPEIHLSDWELRPRVLAPELCPRLDCTPPLWAFIVIIVLILIIVISHQRRSKELFISKRLISLHP